MEYKEILGILITIGVFVGLALVGVGIRYLCKWLSTKTDNELIKSIIDEIQIKCEKAVDYVNQTYVNALKEQGEFTLGAQKSAFVQASNRILATLSQSAKDYLQSLSNLPLDQSPYLEMLIECAVNEAKRWGSGVTKEEQKERSEKFTESVQRIIAENEENK